MHGAGDEWRRRRPCAAAATTRRRVAAVCATARSRSARPGRPSRPPRNPRATVSARRRTSSPSPIAPTGRRAPARTPTRPADLTMELQQRVSAERRGDVPEPGHEHELEAHQRQSDEPERDRQLRPESGPGRSPRSRRTPGARGRRRGTPAPEDRPDRERHPRRPRIRAIYPNVRVGSAAALEPRQLGLARVDEPAAARHAHAQRTRQVVVRAVDHAALRRQRHGQRMRGAGIA